MHEDTITIRKLWSPYSPGDKRTTLEDTDGNKYRIEVITGAGFHDGDIVSIGWTPEKTDAKFGGKEYKFIKNIKLVTPPPFKVDGHTPAVPGEVGPHLAMWEKLFFEALVTKGAPPNIVTAVDARLMARATLQTNIDAKIPEPAEFNDSLEIPD